MSTSNVWFQVKVRKGSDLSKQYGISHHSYYWCKRVDQYGYYIFGNSQHGPYRGPLTEEYMQQNTEAYRNEQGRLRRASEKEAQEIDYNLNWYLSK